MHINIYVFQNWDKNLSHKKMHYSYSKKVFTQRANPIQITRGLFYTPCLMDECSSFWGMSAKLRKSTVSFVMSIGPSAWNNYAPNWQIFMKLGDFFKSVQKIIRM